MIDLQDDKKKESNKLRLFHKILIILSISIISIAFLLVVMGDSCKFNDFDGPKYIPADYNTTNNQTTDNERIFEYNGNGTFWVGVVKDINKEDLSDLLNPFKEDPPTIKQTKENITVTGHSVLFEVHTMEMNMKEMTSNISSLSGYNIPNLSLSKFNAEWHCEKSNLTYVATGFVTANQLDEMKKMVQSIECHANKKYIIF